MGAFFRKPGRKRGSGARGGRWMSGGEIPVYNGKRKEVTRFPGGKQEPGTGGFQGFRDFDGKPLPESSGNGQSTENTNTLENSAKPTLTNVRDRSIIPVLLNTKCEYYPFGGCIV